MEEMIKDEGLGKVIDAVKDLITQVDDKIKCAVNVG